MREQKKNQSAPNAFDGVDLNSPESGRMDESPLPAMDEDLRALLDDWQSPLKEEVVPASLDARVFNSYRELLKEKEMNLHHRSDHLAPQYALQPVGGGVRGGGESSGVAERSFDLVRV